jgi:5,5'-dehydrodivanillate O-demethylase
MSDIEFRRMRNERLTQIGPGTPMGEYMRFYWHPIAAVAELDKWPVKKVRLLGEDLALYRSENGTLGLVADRCPHRGASLSCGMTEGSNLVCAYHGWAFDPQGNCVDTPAEPEGSRLKDRIAIAGYPVEVMAGMVWAYLGKLPAPQLPRYEHLVREGWNRSVGVTTLPCNWLQCAENTLDPLHVEFLHMKYTNWVRKQLGQPPIPVRKHARVGYDTFEYGLIKKRLWIGDTEDSEEWTVGHPLIYPGTLLVPYHAGWVQFQFRVPIDDTHTLLYWYDCKEAKPGETASAEVPIWDNPYANPDGSFRPEVINVQDMMVWITQGPVTDHTRENLGESDRGVALLRRTLLEQLDRIAAGHDPQGVVRDPAKVQPWIELPIEKHIGYSLAGAATSAQYAFPERDGTETELLPAGRP